MWQGTRRDFLRLSGGAATVAACGAACEVSGHSTPTGRAAVEVLNPRMRVPLSFIIDDSTCLVNMGRFCMPQFAATWPDRADYRKPWKSWPAEIPDSFVRQFGTWCTEHGVKGKYSVVPYPACVGWIDRELPGWSRRELLASLDLIRELMVPHWDIHPEMISHTRVIDLPSGRPVADISPPNMENWYPGTHKSVDELAAYLAYALRILKNCDLSCEGVTTPGGFGNGVENELSLAVQEAVRDVYGAAIPHYFKFVAEGEASAVPRIEHTRDLESDDPRLTVNVVAGTGDWFGGWDGDDAPDGDKYCNEDATAGRLVELIDREEPAIMLCHWPGMYTHGTQTGFAAFQKIVLALRKHRSDRTIWMKLSEIARYWAARELTRMDWTGGTLVLDAPFAAPQFTLRLARAGDGPPQVTCGDQPLQLARVARPELLETGTWLSESQSCVVCFDLPRGRTTIT